MSNITKGHELYNLLNLEIPNNGEVVASIEVVKENGEKHEITPANVKYAPFLIMYTRLLNTNLEDSNNENFLIGNCSNVKDYTEHNWGIAVTLKEPFKHNVAEETVYDGVITKSDPFKILNFDINGVTSLNIRVEKHSPFFSPKKDETSD